MATVVAHVDHRPMFFICWHQAAVAVHGNFGFEVFDLPQNLLYISCLPHFAQQGFCIRSACCDDHLIELKDLSVGKSYGKYIISQ